MSSQPQKKKSSTSKKKTTTKKKAVTPKKTKKTTTRKTTTKRVASSKNAKAVATDISERLRVRQVRSGIGHAGDLRRTLAALGLKHHQDVVVVPDNPSVRGMLRKVDHLVSVQPEE